MPADERLERCDRHPGSPALARCDGCGRPLCLVCATPVRGLTYGAECLGAVLGEDAPATQTPGRAPDATARTLARIGFAIAVLSTALPWSRFGPGSEAFGAWSRSGHWSVAAGVAALLGLGLSLAQLRARLRTPGWDVAVALLGAVVTIASLLAVAAPPEFSRPWLGPWLAALAGALACGATVVASRAGSPSPVRI